MKKVLKIFLLASTSILIGCGGGGGSSTTSESEQIGDKFIQIFAIANKAVPVVTDREEFSFSKYDDINEYVDSLKQSIVCEKGSISIEVVDENNSCGEYKVEADNCYINGKLAFDGQANITLVNLDNLGCYIQKTEALTDVSLNKNILGEDKKFTYKKGFVKTYDGDEYKYNITGNGVVVVDNVSYTLENFNNYIENDTFVYNGGSISNNEYKLNFTDLGEETKVYEGSVLDDGFEIFIVNSKYYGIINDTSNKVYVHDKDDKLISKEYDFNKVYDVFE